MKYACWLDRIGELRIYCLISHFVVIKMGFYPLGHAVLCGVAGFSATVIGSIFFKLE